MSKKSLLICMVLVAVFGFFQTCYAELVGYWRFDDGVGTTAVDSSGYGHDAAVEGGGDSVWVEGQLGDGVALGNGVWVSVPPEAWAPIETEFTVAFWAFGYDGLGNNWGFFATGAGANRVAGSHIPWSDGNVYFDSADSAGQWQPERIFTALDAGLATGVWNHWAFTKNTETGEKIIYLNGEPFLSGANATGLITEIDTFAIGSGPNGANPYLGVIDDFRLYDAELTQGEILAAMAGGGGGFPLALRPDPEDGAMVEATWANLSWRAGSWAVSHDAYLGDNFDDVNDGAEGAFVGNQAATTLIVGFAGFPIPDGLVPGTTYYWRIDEVNDANAASPWKGDVWSFWVPPKTAYEAVPSDEAQFVTADVTLGWTAGFNAKLHTVYFGDNFDEVNNASGGVAQTDTTFTPGTLELDKTYYWRVDEFDPPATHKGDVWSFTTLPDIAVTDPALMGWWTFEEDMGTTAVDWSGHGRHGMFVGEPQWVAGYDGGAVEFDGSSYVDTGYTENLAEWTIACWVKSPAAPSGASPSGPMHREQNYQFNWNHGDEIYRGAAAMNVGGWQAASYMPLQANRWYHLAATYDGSVFNAYRDGVLTTSNPAPSGAPNAESNSLKLGRHAAASQFFTGTVDEARVYNRALTAEEIVAVMKGDTSIAWSPNPGNGTLVEIGQALPLSWTAGDNAAQHDVYFGTDRAAVAAADASDTAGIYRGRQSAATYNPTDEVEWGGGPYFWRVDESNKDGTIGTGKLWTFAVADYLIVDDFESYNDIDEGEPGSNRIYLTWIDGFGTTTNGSQAGNLDPPFMSQGRNSAQAMPLSYDNAGKTSEATMTLVSRKDWTEHGVTKLVLWFNGDSANAAERMFVALGNAIVYHPDDAATQDGGWNEWVIDLTEFAGVDLANVPSITIGFGTRGAPVATGGTGTVHFDDIRLIQ